MKKLFITVIAVFFMMTVPAVAGEPIALKFACFEPPKSAPFIFGYKPLVDMMNRDSGGTLDITTYPGGTLGRDPRLQLKLVMDGVVDFASIVSDYTPGRFPDNEVFKAPFYAQDQLEGSLAAQGMFNKGLLRGVDDMVVIGFRTTEPYYIQTTFPVNKPEDLKGHKFRVAGKFHADVLKHLGVSVVGTIPITKTAEAISRKVIDGTLCDTTGLFAFRIGDATKYHVKLPLGAITILLAMNKQKYESLPPQAKAAIDKHRGLPFVRMVSEAQNGMNKKLLAKLEKDPKHTVLIPSGENLQQWKAVIQPVTENWGKTTPNGEKLLKAYQLELDRIRAGK